MRFCQIAFGSAEYVLEMRLRDDVLRAPLGMKLSADDTAGDAEQLHFVAMEADAVLACVLFKRLSLTEIKLRQMAVASHLQGQGVGQQLVRHAEDEAKASGFTRVVTDARIKAQNFYTKLGYRVEGEPYEVRGIPSILMSKTL